MKTILYNAILVNEGSTTPGFLIISHSLIERVGEGSPAPRTIASCDEAVDLHGAYIFPGVIDVHVHFREPGMTRKADIRSESLAALHGGVTSYLEMPNTSPPTTTLAALADKEAIAARDSAVNYAFFQGATNDNIDELRRADYSAVPGIKVFMGSSTGNMLVDRAAQLDDIFSLGHLVAVHCEDEQTIAANAAAAREKYPAGEVPVSEHPAIRSREACIRSTQHALQLARLHDTRLHICHLTTAEEVSMLPDSRKVSAEACVAHLYFTDEDYPRLGTKIKCNPAVKTKADREALREGVRTGRIPVVATDHAPHLLIEKEGGALKAVSGMPMVQFSLPLMLKMADEGVFTLPLVAQVMAHGPAEMFRIERRGFLREGYFADLTIVERLPMTVSADIIKSKCGWSPLEGTTLPMSVTKVYVNGRLALDSGEVLPHTAHHLSFKSLSHNKC